MSRWGTFTWGDVKWGSSNLNTLLWAFEVDWDNDSVFDGSNEANRMTSLVVTRGRKGLVKMTGKGFEKMSIGSITATLDNHDERYDPYNTVSPLYPNIWKDRYCRIKVKNGSSGTFHDVFSGIIDDIVPISGRDEVRITAKDGWKMLNETKVTVALQENIRIDDAIGLVLDAVNWPTLWGRSHDTARVTLDYWWADDAYAGDVIRDLVDREIGHFYLAADGCATFKERFDDSAAVFSLTQSDFLKDFATKQPWETKRNVVQVLTHGIKEHAQSDLWTMQEVMRIGVDETISITVQYTFDNQRLPATDVISPVIEVDYAINSQIDGEGNDLSADFVISATPYAKTAVITITNNSGQVGYITFLKLRGNALDQPDTTEYKKDASGTNPERLFIVDNPWMFSVLSARGYANYMAAFLNEDNTYLTIYQEDQADHQFGVDLLDVLDVEITKKSIDALYRLGYLEHRWQSSSGQLVRTTWYLEPTRDISSYWRVGQSKLGSETKVAYGG